MKPLKPPPHRADPDSNDTDPNYYHGRQAVASPDSSSPLVSDSSSEPPAFTPQSSLYNPAIHSVTDTFGSSHVPTDDPVLNTKIQMGQLLKQKGYITEGQLQLALAEQETNTDAQLGELCVKKGWITENQLAKVIKGIGRKMRLGEYLVDEGFISTSNKEEALDVQRQERENHGKSRPLGEILMEKGYLKQYEFLQALSKHLGVQYLDISKDDFAIVDPEMRERFGLMGLSRDFWEAHKMIPVFYLEGEYLDDKKDEQAPGKLSVVTSDPLNYDGIKEVEERTHTIVYAYVGNYDYIQKGLHKLYSAPISQTSAGQMSKKEEREYIRYLNKLIFLAILKGGSDIHVEPREAEIIIRMRVHGVLKILESLPIEKFNGLLNVIKITADMDISNKHHPQDGRFPRALGGHLLDVRVNTLPGLFGEKIVMRILMQDMSSQTLYDSNFPPRLEKQIIKAITKKNGVILVTGPTGSGKTTTLHRLLKFIASKEVNIQTIEDPVEYRAGEFINQSNINPRRHFGYPDAIRSVLRQDPDVIMVGEIRDKETAIMATECALTGHLVFSSLHTEDSLGSIVRLIQLGVAEWLISSTVVTVLNQRLVRKLCSCARPMTQLPDRDFLTRLEIDDDVIEDMERNFHRYNFKEPVGCTACDGEGFSTMQVVVEQLTLSAKVKELIREAVPYKDIVNYIRSEHSMNMLFEEGLRQVLLGVTHFEELRDIPRGDYEMKPPDQILKDATETDQIKHVEKARPTLPHPSSYREEKILSKAQSSADLEAQNIIHQALNLPYSTSSSPAPDSLPPTHPPYTDTKLASKERESHSVSHERSPRDPLDAYRATSSLNRGNLPTAQARQSDYSESSENIADEAVLRAQAKAKALAEALAEAQAEAQALADAHVAAQMQQRFNPKQQSELIDRLETFNQAQLEELERLRKENEQFKTEIVRLMKSH
jgi:type IV pilus assembly protein PilB